MIVLGIIVSIAAIGTMCWLLFNLAVFALPFFIGLNAGIWAYGTGAGWPGGILIGLIAAGLILAVGQGLLMLVRPIWARLLIALAFVAILFLIAAVTGTPDEATGLDGAMRKLTELPGGSLPLLVIAVGFAAYGVYSLARARFAGV